MNTSESAVNTVQVSLATKDASVLREALAAYLSELRLETARTDDKDFRDHLWERERVIERVIAQLGGQTA